MPKDKLKKSGVAKQEPNSTDRRGTVSAREIAFEWGRSIAIAVGLAMLIRWPVAEPFKIPSGSMEPTFYSGDRIFVNKHAYGVRYPFNGFRIPFTRSTIWYSESQLWKGSGPERWDIVVFKSVETNAEHDTLVKRIVGLPGERVHINGAEGKLYIDGVAVETPPDMTGVKYTFEPMSKGYGLGMEDEFALVPEGHYFLLGDNSAHSRDARWFGWVPGRHILGRVTSIWWPLSRWRDLTGFSGSWWWISAWSLTGFLTFVRLFVGRSCHVREELLGGEIRRNDRLFVRFSLGLPLPFTRKRVGTGRAVARGDMVLYRAGEGNDEMRLGVVAGLPGERVFLADGKLQIDDKPIEIPGPLSGLAISTGGEHGAYGGSKGRKFSLVPDNHYYIVLDDISGETDSRNLGWIPREAIVGTATARWWPMLRLRRLRSA